ncbi:MAG TPA: glycine/sarcosine/betaine reductase complex component C subunit beta [Spirochaetia bacterium]
MNPVVTACSYELFHCPFFTVEHGTTPESERAANPDSDFLKALPGALRSFDEVVAYPANQAFIGVTSPRDLPPRPWTTSAAPGAPRGPFGAILPERMLYALMKLADTFELVVLEAGFLDEARALLAADDATAGADLSRFKDAVDAAALEGEIAAGALPLMSGGKILGCVKAAHPTDINLGAHTMLENLASKATAVYALRRLLQDGGIDPTGIDYIIETSEEACGDMNQRGGGNFAKSIGELCGLLNATGCDVRSFCAGPTHGILHAASMVRAGTVKRVVVVAGGTTAKLAMNAKKHIEKGFPVLEDCMGSFALLVDGDAAEGLLLRDDVTGMHKIGSGSSPQAVVQDLVAAPLARAGLRFSDIDCYAPELQNPEITEAAGAGNVTLANIKMIAAMAVMKKEIEKSGMDAFIEAHGVTGWAPTQGHIPSGVPALGWFLRWAREGRFHRGLLIGKGSLFLGRMTNLFDGVSILIEAWKRGADAGAAPSVARGAAAAAERLRIGLTIPGSEAGRDELLRGATDAARRDPTVEPVLFGADGDDDAQKAHRDMETALRKGDIRAAVTFHYPFAIGVSTVGHCTAPGNGRELFIATTTGTASTDRVEALVRNAIAGNAVAKACGIAEPAVGFLNLDGAARALQIARALADAGYPLKIAGSSRGDALLRGNDILAGAVDVLVCDSLTGNAIVKLLSTFTTAGRVEVSGDGYGPGMGEGAPTVAIISRATAAPVVANALLFMARVVRGGAYALYKEEIARAERAGLAGMLAEGRPKTAEGWGPAAPGQAPGGAREPDLRALGAETGLAQKVVEHEIEGIDVLDIEEAVRLLLSKGVYCRPAMGCTGPIVLVASEDAAVAERHLRGAHILT